MPKIAIIGSGYVGLVTAACLAQAGNKVVAYDIDKEKIRQLKKAQIPFYEEKLAELIAQQKDRNLTFCDDIKIALHDAKACFIAVSTPHDEKNNCPNLEYFYNAIDDVLANLQQDLLIINKSTLPIGTAAKLQNIIANRNLAYNVSVASNPEFLSQGRAVDDFLLPQRIVFGVEDEKHYQLLCDIYNVFIKQQVKIVKTNIATAELIKYAANSFLATKVAFINEMAQISAKLGANINDISYAMGLDNRIGNKFLAAGPGYGGSCFPKDTKALSLAADNLGLDLPLLTNIDNSNQTVIKNITNKIYQIIKNSGQKEITILGLSFKVGTDDIRDSQAIKIIKGLLVLDNELKIYIHDPKALENSKKLFAQQKNIIAINDSEKLPNNNPIYVIVTGWEIYKKFSDNIAKQSIIIDLRSICTRREHNYFRLGDNF